MASHMYILLVCCVILQIKLSLYGVAGQSMDQMIMAAMTHSDQMSMLRNDSVMVELDMMFTKEDWEWIQQENDKAETDRSNRKATHPATNRRWTNKVVPYVLQNVFSSADMAQINAAIGDWNRYTCLTFRRRTNDRNYLWIGNDRGCYSYVGMMGGAQILSLAPLCRSKGIIIHELGHAIGFQHEQTRPDRDQHVTIDYDNIQRGTEYNFQKYSTSVVKNYGVPYDYSSVMHYGSTAFSVNGRRTITTQDVSKQGLIGNRFGLSFRDIKMANLMYSCNGNCPKKSCPGEGFVGKDCECWCPGNPVQNCADNGGGEVDCQDSNPNCVRWAAAGECEKNPAYMNTNCKESCETCDDNEDCEDMNKDCAYWSGLGYCDNATYQKYMAANCKKACGLCPPDCEDNSTVCPRWSMQGYCVSHNIVYLRYMVANCKKSCNLC